MTIYDLDIKGMRKALRKFSQTLYGRTVFFIAFFMPFLAALAFVGLFIAYLITPQVDIFAAFCAAFFVFLVSFLIGLAYYYRELREFVKK